MKLQRFAPMLLIAALILLASCSGQTQLPSAPATAVGSLEPSVAVSTAPSLPTTTEGSESPTAEPTPTVWEMATPGPVPTARAKASKLFASDFFFIYQDNRTYNELVQEEDGDSETIARYGVVNRRGELVLPIVYSDVLLFAEDNGILSLFFVRPYQLTIHRLYDAEGNETKRKTLAPADYGSFYSPDGRLYNKRKYSYAYQLKNQLIEARIYKGKTGVMDYGLKPIIPFKYDMVYQMKHLFAALCEESGRHYIDFYTFAGQLKSRLQVYSEYVYFNEYLDDSVILAQGMNKKFGFIDEKMTWAQLPSISIKREDYEYDESGVMYDALDQYVEDLKQKEYAKLLPPGYTSIQPLLDDDDKQTNYHGKLLFLAEKQINEYAIQNALVDQSGHVLFESNVHDYRSPIMVYSEGYILIEGKVYDFNGKDVLPDANDIRYYLEDEKLFLGVDKCYSPDGKVVLFPLAEQVQYVEKDRFVVITSENKQGMCNKAGQWFLLPSDNFSFTENPDSIGYEYGWHIVSRINNPNLDSEYSTYGLIDSNGKIILDPIYDYITQESDDVYSVQFGYNYGLVDAQGNWIWHSNEYDRLID